MYSAEALSLLQKTDLAVSTLEPLMRQASTGGLAQGAGSRGVLARYSWGGGVDRADLDEAGPKLDASSLFLNRWFPISLFSPRWNLTLALHWTTLVHPRAGYFHCCSPNRYGTAICKRGIDSRWYSHVPYSICTIRYQIDTTKTYHTVPY